MSLIRRLIIDFGSAKTMRRALPRLLAVVLVATQAGCATFSNSDTSQVAQGTRYVTGQTKFDAFFATLHEHQQKLEKAPGEELNVRQNLAKDLAENAQASASALGKAVRRRVERMARAGVSMRLELDDDDEQTAKADVIVGGRALSETDKAFLQALGRTAQNELKLSLGMARSRRALEELRFSAVGLENEIDSVFRKSGPRKKAEVRQNMQDAVALFPVMISRAGEVEANAERFLRKLVDGLRVDPPPSSEGLAVEPGSEPRSSGRSLPAQSSSPGPRPNPPPAAPTPPPPNKAQPPAAPAQDFEP